MPDDEPLGYLSAGLDEAKAAQAALDRAISALEEALQRAIQGGLYALPS